MIRTAEAVIDLSALKHNLSQVRRVVGASRIMAVVKANAYGHGMLEVANALKQVDAFAVACVNEGVALREAGLSNPIGVLQGFKDGEELRLCDRYDLAPVIHQSWQIDLLQNYSTRSAIKSWIKVSTGMNRLGVAPEEFYSSLQKLKALKQVSLLGFMTHFANADAAIESNMIVDQLQCFSEVTKGCVGERTAANSAALLACKQSHLDWVRPGLLLYGLNPFGNVPDNEYNLKPVMTLKSRMIAINHCKKGDTIGYGRQWVCPQDMPVGVVAIGYGDGYPRSIVEGTPVLLGEQLVPIIGRVSMDMITIDLSGAKNAKIGDDIILWGSQLAVERIAEAAGTISYELLCSVYGRVQFRYMDNN